MKPGTFLWAMEQLIAGKKVARQEWKNQKVYYYLKDGKVMAEHGDGSYPTNVLLPGEIILTTDWIIWHPPVNYIPGTFPWAWEQLKAGKTMQVNKGGEHHRFVRFAKSRFEWNQDKTIYYNTVMNMHFINATDWEVVE